MKLLIVEDNPAMRELIKSIVRNIAENVIECSDGSEAYAAYVEHRPDVVLMDIKMGTMDGLTATEMITKRFPDAKIVMLTNHDDQDLRESALAAGASEYILKEDLRAVGQLLSRWEKSRANHG